MISFLELRSLLQVLDVYTTYYGEIYEKGTTKGLVGALAGSFGAEEID